MKLGSNGLIDRCRNVLAFLNVLKRKQSTFSGHVLKPGRWTGRWTMDAGRWTLDDGRPSSRL